jgi:hypothetical protein
MRLAACRCVTVQVAPVIRLGGSFRCRRSEPRFLANLGRRLPEAAQTPL